MDDEPELLEVVLTDRCRIHRSTCGISIEPGLLFGNWSVSESSTRNSHDADCEPYNWTVSHNPSGFSVLKGFMFFEARMVAMVLHDSGFAPKLRSSNLDPDDGCLIEALIASALMEHYVFPIDKWSPGE